MNNIGFNSVFIVHNKDGILMKLDMSLSNLSKAFPDDFTPDQRARAQTLFLKKLSVKAHSFYGGKMQTVPKAGVYGFNWFNVWYTPGVSKVSTTIRDNNDESFALSNRGNLVAVVSDSTRVLGDGGLHASGWPGRHGREGFPHEIPGRGRLHSALRRFAREGRQA